LSYGFVSKTERREILLICHGIKQLPISLFAANYSEKNIRTEESNMRV